MKKIALVAGLADNSGTYVAVGDTRWGGGSGRGGLVTFHSGVMRNPKPFLVDGEIAAWSLAAIGGEGVRPLMELLDDPNLRLRLRAVEALGMVGGAAEPAVPALVKMLNDPDLDLRSRAANALGCIGRQPDQVVPALMVALTDPQMGVDCYAAESLGDFRERATNAIPALLWNFASRDYRIEDAAALALSKISSEVTAKEVIPVLLGDLKGSSSFGGTMSANMSLITLGQMKDEADLVIPAIIGVTRNPDYNEMDRGNAIRMLGGFGPGARAAVDELRGMTNDPDIQVRTQALRAWQYMESGPAR
jgi:HEAT repeat protein